MTPRDFLFLPPAPAGSRESYGPEALHFGDWREPAGEGPHPLLLVIHGGFWRNTLDLTHMGRLCAALAAEGIATYSIEYRRLGDPGGGWPGTFEDVRRAAEFVRERSGSVGALGFSAGGHLALLLAAECGWLRGAVGLAPAADLALAWEQGLGNGAAAEFLDGRMEDIPAASPLNHPPRAPVRIVHGTADDVVPRELSRRYAAAHPCELREIEGANHFDMLNPESIAWPAVRGAVLGLFEGKALPDAHS